MRLLLDESLPRGLKSELAPHDVKTVPEMGWTGKDSGDLLRLASRQFDVFVTADQGIQYQQNLAGFDIFARDMDSSGGRAAGHSRIR